MAKEDCYGNIKEVINALEEVKERTKTSNARDLIRDLIFRLRREYRVQREIDPYK